MLVNKSTPGFAASMKMFFKRLVRLSMCFHPVLANQHLLLLDSYILYEIDLFSELLASHKEEAGKSARVTGLVVPRLTRAQTSRPSTVPAPSAPRRCRRRPTASPRRCAAAAFSASRGC